MNTDAHKEENDRLKVIIRRLRGRLLQVCQDNDLMTDDDAEVLAEAEELVPYQSSTG
jgi:hypothetical protein